MTTKQQVRRLLAPLCEAQDDVVMIGKLPIVMPLRHLLRTVFIDRTSSANWFRVWCTVQDLSLGYDNISFLEEDEVQRPIDQKLRQELLKLPYDDPRRRKLAWYWNSPDMPDDFADLFETVMLPRLCAVDSHRALYAYRFPPDKQRKPWSIDREAALKIMTGDLDAAAELLAAPREGWFGPRYREVLNRVLDGVGDRIVEMGNALPAADRQRLADRYHRWEERTVTSLKLEQIWERTPFAFEEMGP